MSDQWTTDDPRLRPLLPSQYTFHRVPAAPHAGAKWDLYVLDSSRLKAPRRDFSSFATRDELAVVPSFSFLIQRNDTGGKGPGEAALFDLGLREDPENFMPVTQPLLSRYQPIPAPGPIKRLQTGNYDTSQLKHVFLSHMHFDHYGNLGTLAEIKPRIVCGEGTLERIGAGYPEKQDSPWPSEWLRDLDIVDLTDLRALDQEGSSGAEVRDGLGKTRQWGKVACFDKALDWYGDGSFWLISAHGHCVGHMMALVRVTTSPDTYVLLCGDSAHAQECYLPIPPSDDPDSDPRAPRTLWDNGQPAMSDDPTQSAFDVGSLTRMSMEDNIMVLLAHETHAEKVLPRWPESISEWKQKGWKEEKQKEVYEQARQKGYKV